MRSWTYLNTVLQAVKLNITVSIPHPLSRTAAGAVATSYGKAHLPAGVGDLATGLADYRGKLSVRDLFQVLMMVEAVSNASGERTVDADNFSHLDGGYRLSKKTMFVMNKREREMLKYGPKCRWLRSRSC